MKAPTKIWLRPVGRDRGWHLAAAPTRVEALKAAAEYLGPSTSAGGGIRPADTDADGATHGPIE
jgi:hypothetical protein